MRVEHPALVEHIPRVERTNLVEVTTCCNGAVQAPPPPNPSTLRVVNTRQCATVDCTHTVYSNMAQTRACNPDVEGQVAYFEFDIDTETESLLQLTLDTDGSVGAAHGYVTKGTYCVNGIPWTASGYYTSEISQLDANRRAQSALSDRLTYEQFFNNVIIECGIGESVCDGSTISSIDDAVWRITDNNDNPYNSSPAYGLTMAGGSGSFSLANSAVFAHMGSAGLGGGSDPPDSGATAWPQNDLCFSNEVTVTIAFNGTATNSLAGFYFGTQIRGPLGDAQDLDFGSYFGGPGGVSHTFVTTVPAFTPFAITIRAETSVSPMATLSGTVTITIT